MNTFFNLFRRVLVDINIQWSQTPFHVKMADDDLMIPQNNIIACLVHQFPHQFIGKTLLIQFQMNKFMGINKPAHAVVFKHQGIAIFDVIHRRPFWIIKTILDQLKHDIKWRECENKHHHPLSTPA